MAAIGHRAENVPSGEGVELVCSAAIAPANPERVAALERGLAVLTRAELLGQLSALRRTIAVAGAHGKTTTASMLVSALRAGGLNPSYLIGGMLRETGRNGDWFDGEWLVVEADESDRSMLSLRVEIAVLTSVELDHHDSFGSLRELEAAYREFLAGAAQAVIWNRPELLALRDGPLIAYDAAAPTLTAGGSRFEFDGIEVELRVPGEHNARNAAAALSVATLVGVRAADAARGLAAFSGAARRFERLGRSAGGAEVYDDYAHHPTEVAATLAAARTLEPSRLSSSSSRTCTRARGRWRASSASRSPRPTRWSCSTSIRRASGLRTFPASAACCSPRRPSTRRRGSPPTGSPTANRPPAWWTR